MITPSFGLTSTERVLPRFALDFTTESLDSRVTFTRSGNTATVTNSSGYVVGINADLPRFDYDPITLVCNGLLIEEARTNLLLQSQTFQTTWAALRASVSADATTAPDNLTTGDKLVEDTTASNTHFVNQAIALSALVYTYSVYLKAGERTWARLTLLDGVTTFGAYFNLSTGAIGVLSGGATAAISSVGNGWYRCSITTTTVTATATGNARVILATGDSGQTYTGDGTSGIYVWGAQLEAGAFATSYIPTTTTALTRNADVATMTGVNFSDWFNASQGTLYAKGTTFNGQGTASYANALFAVTDNVNDFCCLNRYGNAASGTVRNGGVTQAFFTVADGWLGGETHSAAIAYKDADFGYALDGVAEAPVTSGSIPAGVDRAYIGRSFDGSDFRTWNGHVLELSYYPQRLTDAELAAITA